MFCDRMEDFMKKHITKKCLAALLLIAISVTSIQTAPQKAEAMSKPSISVNKRTKTTATIKIAKLKQVTGYQVFLATSKKGKYKQIGATRTTSFQITKINKNKVYYVKVRAYKTVGSRIVTSGYSSVVQVKKYTVETTADKYAKEVLSLVNKERAKAGLNELKKNTSLNAAAITRAKELASEFSHTRPDGRDCFTVLTEAGIVYASVGENIAAGQSSPASVVSSWMDSEGHRANILSSDYTHMGVGYYHTSKGNQHYWVQIFMKE